MPLSSLKDLYVEELSDIYSAEKQITQALPKMAKAASSETLRQAFEEHLTQTEGQIARLDQIFQKLGRNPSGKKCKAMEGLVEEGQEIITKGGDPDTVDAALICAAQKVEHYEMASYGTARTWARLLGDEEAAGLLQQTLEEEGDTDKRLTGLAETCINREATS